MKRTEPSPLDSVWHGLKSAAFQSTPNERLQFLESFFGYFCQSCGRLRTTSDSLEYWIPYPDVKPHEEAIYIVAVDSPDGQIVTWGEWAPKEGASPCSQWICDQRIEGQITHFRYFPKGPSK